jgi:hypothetical protein
MRGHPVLWLHARMHAPRAPPEQDLPEAGGPDARLGSRQLPCNRLLVFDALAPTQEHH